MRTPPCHNYLARPKQHDPLASPGTRRNRHPLALLALLTLAVVGCAKKAEDTAEHEKERQQQRHFEEHIRPRLDLMALACLYLDCEEKQRRSPTALNDLQGHSAMERRALRGLREGRYALHWGIALRGLHPADRSQTVLGYETTSSARGTRWVVTIEAHVRELTEQEFKQVMAHQSGGSAPSRGR